MLYLRSVTSSKTADETARGHAPGRWALLGDRVLSEEAPRATAEQGQLVRQEDVPWERLFLVIQTGAAFQQAWPAARVIVDRGRHLVVELDAEAERGARASARDYRLEPLPEGARILERRPAGRGAARGRGAVAAREQAIVDQVSSEALRATLEQLTAWPTRLSSSPEYQEAAEWMRQQLASLGYQTEVQSVSVPGGESLNVIADRPGNGSGERRAVLVTAHLDSINLAGASEPAPGADDNGSGSAGLLEIARVLSGSEAPADLRFLLFGGEEQGLFGSEHYVSRLSAQARASISAVVNMDMVASRNSQAPGVLLEGSEAARGVLDGLAAMAAAYTDLAVEVSLRPFNSDHVSFLDAGIPAVLTIEGTDQANRSVHSARDTLQTVDLELFSAIVRMNAAFVSAALAGGEG
jgi:hypothetical protein